MIAVLLDGAVWPDFRLKESLKLLPGKPICSFSLRGDLFPLLGAALVVGQPSPRAGLGEPLMGEGPQGSKPESLWEGSPRGLPEHMEGLLLKCWEQ